MRRNRLIEEWYFEWLCEKIEQRCYNEDMTFVNLLRTLHEIDFRVIIPKDENRADDGIDLRDRFIDERLTQSYPGIYYGYLQGPCSVLEMMVALAIRCEEDIMDDPAIGDRTGQWFWAMVVNLGLGSMTDDKFDRDYVEDVIDVFLERNYEPNGKGGLFYIRNCDADLRDIEIWMQLCWYLPEN